MISCHHCTTTLRYRDAHSIQPHHAQFSNSKIFTILRVKPGDETLLHDVPSDATPGRRKLPSRAHIFVNVQDHYVVNPVEVSCDCHHARLSRTTSLTTCFRKEMQIGQPPQLILHEENNAAQEACLVTH